MTAPIDGIRLTAWEMTPDGERVRLGFDDAEGKGCEISLPVSQLSALMMTIPRMLQRALSAQFSDGSLRMIHELGNWRLEHAAGTDAAILSLGTVDGFEVAFAVAANEVERLARSLRAATAMPETAAFN